MKLIKNTLKLAVVTLIFVLNSTNASAQMPTSYEIGSITSDHCVSIDTSKPLAEFYQIDIAALNFATETDAKKLFGYISNNRLTYIVDFPNHVAYLKVHADRTQFPQDVIWWNDYIQGLCSNQ